MSTPHLIRTIALALSVLLVITTAALTAGPAPPAGATVPTIAQKLAVPSYIHPNASPEDWSRLALSQPGSVGIAVANVINGPDYTPMPEWASVIHAVAAHGVKVVGYVDTGYLGSTGQRTRLGSTRSEDWLAQIQQDVAAWYAFYGADLSGIFFDQGQNACGPSGTSQWVDLYRRIHDDVHRLHPGALTVLNPGTIVPKCYEHAADVLVTFEGSYASYVNDPAAALQYAPLGWDPVDPMKVWHIVYDAATPEQMATVMALGKSRGAGFMYVTNDVLANPYDRLPPADYWLAEELNALTLPDGVLLPPSSPTFVDSVQHYATAIDIDWWPSIPGTAPVVAYDVYRDGVWVGSVPATTTKYRVVNLQPVSTYTFTVVARDALGKVSPPSAPLVERSDQTYGDPPNAPVQVAASATGYTSTTLSWMPSPEGIKKGKPPIEHFVVLRNGKPIMRLPGSARSVTVGKLAPGASYQFSLVAIDATGDSSRPSGIVGVTTPMLPGGTIGQFTVSQTPDQLTYGAEFLVPFAFRRVFLKTDDPGNVCWSTGSEPQLCADYVIENERLLRYAGNGVDWEWTVVRDVQPSVAGAMFTWSILPADVGGANVVDAVFNANGYAPNSYCGPSVTCASYGPPLPYA